MSAEIFISFASKDVKIALTLCQAIEGRGFKCWISARDIQAGENFQVAIVQALRRAKILLLVFTANSNTSEEMTKELALASQLKMMVIPLRVEDVAPGDAFAYEFATRQWIDAFADWEFSIEQLCRRIEHALAGRGEEAVAAPLPTVNLQPPMPQPEPEPEEAAVAEPAPAPKVKPRKLADAVPEIKPAPEPGPPPAFDDDEVARPRGGAGRFVAAAVLIVVVGAAAVAGFALLDRKPDVAAEDTIPATTPQVVTVTPLDTNEPAMAPNALNETSETTELAAAEKPKPKPAKKRQPVQSESSSAVDIPY